MNIIVAVDKNWGIGKNNQLLMRIPQDMKRFRELTMGGVVIMGRKTFESLPGGALDGRTNMVMTKSSEFNTKDVITCCGIGEMIEQVKEFEDDDVFVIGGAAVYEQLLQFCKRAYVTKIDAEFDADCHMVNLDEQENWEIEEKGEEQEYEGVNYRFVVYKNKGV